MHLSFLDISQTFSFFPRREMTDFAIVWTTWEYDDKCSILSSYLRLEARVPIKYRVVRTRFASVMTLNNCERVAETWVYIFWWRSRYRPRCLCWIKARFKRRTLHVPNVMQMSENNRFFSFAIDSAHVKFDVWTGPKLQFQNYDSIYVLIEILLVNPHCH